MRINLQSTHTSISTGIPASVLNARPENVERESEVVAQAGRLGAVTVATNMAGRGTDILLGGSAKGITKVRREKKSLKAGVFVFCLFNYIF